MSNEAFYPQLPPEALELLDDPRTADIKWYGPGMPNDFRMLQPADVPLPGESPYVLFSSKGREDSNASVHWLNEIPYSYSLADRGLAMLGEERPRFHESGKKLRNPPDAWLYLGVIIASPKVAEIMTRHEPAIQTAPIDWTFSDGGRLEGYVFLDIHRTVPAYDYKRSEVRVERNEQGKFIAGLGVTRALKPNLDRSLNAFRESFQLYDIFVCREMAAALLDAGAQVDFLDPATMRAI